MTNHCNDEGVTVLKSVWIAGFIILLFVLWALGPAMIVATVFIASRAVDTGGVLWIMALIITLVVDLVSFCYLLFNAKGYQK